MLPSLHCGRRGFCLSPTHDQYGPVSKRNIDQSVSQVLHDACGAWLQVHQAHALVLDASGDGAASPTSSSSSAASSLQDNYDTFCSAQLVPLDQDAEATGDEKRSRIIENNQNPRYAARFEFADERSAQRLRLRVTNAHSTADLRFSQRLVGQADVVVYDIAHCPNSRVRFTQLQHWSAVLAVSANSVA